MKNINEFNRLVNIAERIFKDGSMNWEAKYDLIFSDNVSVAIYKTRISFDWIDTDTTYEEDVINYVVALIKKNVELTKVSDENQEEKLTEEFIMQNLFDSLSKITLQFEHACKYHDDGWAGSEDWEIIEQCEVALSVSKHSSMIKFE